MKLRPQFVVLAVFLVVAFQLKHAQARGPSTPDERARVIELSRSLEREPLSKDAASTRMWLRTWIVEVPDIRFIVCDDLLGNALGDNYRYLDEVNQQVSFSGASFSLENQGKARDDVAVYHAGVEGALRVYEQLLKSKPDAKSAFLDDLVAKRNRGELFAFVGKLSKEKCKRSNIFLIAAPAGAAVGLVLALIVVMLGGWSTYRGSKLDRLTLTNRGAAIATISRLVVFVCATYYVIVGVALHFLEPEYDPRYRFMSEYAWGNYGWLMTTTFFILGLAIVSVAVAIRAVHPASWSARLGCGLLLVAAAGVCLAGVFREFLPHSVASAVGLPSMITAALFLSLSFRKAEGWKAIHPITILIAFGMVVLLTSVILDVGMPGVQQRGFLFLILMWLSIVANRSVKVARGLAAVKD